MEPEKPEPELEIMDPEDIQKKIKLITLNKVKTLTPLMSVLFHCSEDELFQALSIFSDKLNFKIHENNKSNELKTVTFIKEELEVNPCNAEILSFWEYANPPES